MAKVYYDKESVLPFGIGLAGSYDKCTIVTDQGTYTGVGDSTDEAFANAQEKAMEDLENNN